MKLLIKFPTRGRREKFFSTLKEYQNFITEKNFVTFMINMDLDDESMNNEFVREELEKHDNLIYYYGNSKTKIEAVNSDLEKFKEWDIVLLASDDMIPQVKGFDKIIIDKMKEYFPDTDGILFFNDGYQKNKLNTLCILGKKYFDRFGFIYHPEYKSCWADNEFMEVGNKLNRQQYIDDVIIRHEHPDWGYGMNDSIHKLNQINYHYDLNVYKTHKQNNFFLN